MRNIRLRSRLGRRSQRNRRRRLRLGFLRPESGPPAAQPQRVRHDRHRTHAHRSRPHHRHQEPAKDGVEDAGSQGNAHRVIEERPEEVLRDDAHRGAGEIHCGHGVRQPALHEHHVRRLHSDVGPGADRAANVRAGERGGVIDAVPHHHHGFARGLKRADDLLLVAREHPRRHRVRGQSHGRRHGFCRTLIVARDNPHLEAAREKRLHCLAAVGLHAVRERHDARRHAVDFHRQGGLSRVAQGLDRLQRLAILLGLEDRRVSHRHKAPVRHGFDAPRRLQKFLGGPKGDAFSFNLTHDGLRQRMLAQFLHGARRRKERLPVHGAEGHHVRHFRAAFGHGARLVQHYRRHGLRLFQGGRRLEEKPESSAGARSHHDGSRGRKAQRAGAGDDENAHRGRRRKLPRVPQKEPRYGHHHSNRDHYRHKDGAHPVRQTRHGSLS